MRTNDKAAEAKLLTLLKEIKDTSGPLLQARHYAYWLPCGINRQFFELLDGRTPVPNSWVEDQVSVRAYRIRQKRPVTIYKLISEKRVEQKILELRKAKKNLADALLQGSDVAKKLSRKEILELLQLSA